MKKLLIGLLVLGSFSAIANDRISGISGSCDTSLGQSLTLEGSFSVVHVLNSDGDLTSMQFVHVEIVNDTVTISDGIEKQVKINVNRLNGLGQGIVNGQFIIVDCDLKRGNEEKL